MRYKQNKTPIGLRIKLSAMMVGIRMIDLPAVVGVSYHTFLLRLTGKRQWRPGELKKLADVLGVTVDFLEGGSGLAGV